MINFEFDPQKHEFTSNGVLVPSVTQILCRSGLADYSFLDEEIREYSMARGNSVHWLTQLEDEGALNYRKVPKALRGYRKAWNMWKKNSGFHFFAIEWKFVSEYGFAGIIDRVGYRVGWIGGNRVIVDLKTGPIAAWVRFQMAAYAVAASGIGLTRPPSMIRRIAVRLNSDGTYRTKEFPRSEFQSDWSRFMSAARSVG